MELIVQYKLIFKDLSLKSYKGKRRSDFLKSILETI